jgi:intracellular sulfur oxidation DsrE/DsrF family protein
MAKHHFERRRWFLSRFALGVAGSAIAGETAHAQSIGATDWKPTAHKIDDWLDQIPGKHRLVIDTATPDGFGSALPFLNNYFNVSQSAYGLEDKDSAVVLIARHRATLFAYKDEFWATYGRVIHEATSFKFNDPKTNEAPAINVFNANGYRDTLTNMGWTLDSLISRGVRVAVCEVSARGYANAIADATGKSVSSVYDQLTGMLVSNARMVPAGIVALNRAQERGYALAVTV